MVLGYRLSLDYDYFKSEVVLIRKLVSRRTSTTYYMCMYAYYIHVMLLVQSEVIRWLCFHMLVLQAANPAD